MKLEARKYLYAIQRAANLVRTFTDGKTLPDYVNDSMRKHILIIAGAWLVFIMAAAPAGAEDGAGGSLWQGTYAGILAGTGRLSNTIIDVDGFANWGHPGSTLEYDTSGTVGGAFAGRRFVLGGVNLRYELEWMLGDVSASTDGLDPTCPDEVAATRIRWTMAGRFGVEDRIGPIRLFAVAGPALGRIVNSVTDTDFSGNCLERQLRFDADDSFRSESTRAGWTLGFGLEAEMTPNWALRLDGAYFDFGSQRYRVNLSGNNTCGPGGPRAPCTYSIGNRVTALRIALIYRFGH